MAYGVDLSPVHKTLRKLDAAARKRVLRTLIGLETEPRPPGAKRLAGSEGFLRIRVGAYRIIYTVDEARELVVVLKIGHRRDVYRRR